MICILRTPEDMIPPELCSADRFQETAHIFGSLTRLASPLSAQTFYSVLNAGSPLLSDSFVYRNRTRQLNNVSTTKIEAEIHMQKLNKVARLRGGEL
jgi:hypothetical protein